ncbi:hypothetical protein LJC38_06625, partial [Parabacteroides sp. OttesenSCG-928-K15]|nr:hypothetical protein [Parabacteroides sp. OttesenSCG-928-K15]
PWGRTEGRLAKRRAMEGLSIPSHAHNQAKTKRILSLWFAYSKKALIFAARIPFKIIIINHIGK